MRQDTQSYRSALFADRHPSFALLFFIMVGMLPFLFQDPRFLLPLFLLNLLFVRKGNWTGMLRKAYLVVGGIGGLFTLLSWLPLTQVGYAYWQSEIPLIHYPVQITDTGVLWACGMGLRIANVALLSMYYLMSTSPRQLAMGLRGIGVPYSIGFLLSLIFRFIPLIKHDLGTIREAQMVRGMAFERGNLVRKLKQYVVLLVPLIFTSLKRVQLIANALDAKDFRMRNPQHRFYRMPRWQPIEWLALGACFCAVLALAYMARIHPEHIGVLLPGRI
ncbi:energy-coupling factor transporter transmembrane protein EcfT [Brevibacillus fluminis]|uniref:Energy-coupling factor transporter transmembrane protein EcfT n=1 Tax=Brevibacillus fluminis TaxID=511487 RepID=A0A3M8DHD0_9BACL|nr:energy-coupling factor transporter transmembrane component T [Brevibacillus fluminis]RNB87418.1 energy-coupling factor transporter transmembrane protein EcfT [Brevibacillus fluminis]